MTPQQIGENIGVVIGIVGIISIVIWAIWALIKYKPFSLIVKMLYDIRKFVIQIVLMYSDQKSIFAKKRVESGVMFWWVIGTLTFFIYYKRAILTSTDMLMLTAPILVAAGYAVKQIQDEKKLNKIVDNADGSVNKDKDDQK